MRGIQLLIVNILVVLYK